MHAKSFSDDFKNHFNGVYGSKYIPRKRKHRLIYMKMILRDSSLKADLKGNIKVSYFQMTFILMDVSSERL